MRVLKSFSVLTKEELCKNINEKSCCNLAEFSGMLLFGGSITGDKLKFTTENRDVFDRYRYLCESIGVEAGMSQTLDKSGKSGKSGRYMTLIDEKTQIEKLLKRLGLIAAGVIRYRIASGFLDDECCRKSFVKGAFLGGGSVIDPNKNYNLEIVTPYMRLSEDFLKLLKSLGFEFKKAVRKSKYVLYIKNSEMILDFLTYIGAYRAQMELINIKIEKEIRNDFNRSINSETANWEKTISASVRQVQAIELIEEKIGIDELPEDLKDLAYLRLEHKSKSLQELGELLNLGKSGVNHRFKRIIAIADRLKEE